MRAPSRSPGAHRRCHHGSSRRRCSTIKSRARARRSLQTAGRGAATPPRRAGESTGLQPRDPSTPSPQQPPSETRPWRAPPQRPSRRVAGGRASLHREILPQDKETPRRRRPSRGLSPATSSGDSEGVSEMRGGPAAARSRVPPEPPLKATRRTGCFLLCSFGTLDVQLDRCMCHILTSPATLKPTPL